MATRKKTEETNKENDVILEPVDVKETVKSVKKDKLGIYRIHKNSSDLTKATENSSCYDVRAGFQDGDVIKQVGGDNIEINTTVSGDRFVIYANARALVPTGLKLSIPQGYDVRLYARSGLAFKQGLNLSNSVGVIDNDYKGELFICLHNNTTKPFVINLGDRIAQLEINRVESVDIEVLSEYSDKTERGAGGIGSTGVK